MNKYYREIINAIRYSSILTKNVEFSTIIETGDAEFKCFCTLDALQGHLYENDAQRALSLKQLQDLLLGNGLFCEHVNKSIVSTDLDTTEIICTGYDNTIANSVERVFTCIEGGHYHISNSGKHFQLLNLSNDSRIANSGDYAKIINVKNCCDITTNGNCTRILNHGDAVTISATGYGTIINSDGKNCTISNLSRDGLVKAREGCRITLAEYDCCDNIVSINTTIVDNITICDNKYYKLVDNSFVEVEL